MENLEDKEFAFFMNYFSSLQIWDKFGLLQREITLYNSLAKQFKTLYIFSYGDEKELEYKKYFSENIIIIPKSLHMPDICYEFLIPFLYKNILRNCDFYKTNQNSGAIAPTIAKLLYGKKSIIRSGYIGSELARLSKLPLYARGYFWFAQKFSYSFCDRAFIPTQSNYDILIKKYPNLKGRLFMINNFINTDLFIKQDNIPKIYDIIYVARFDKDKNHLLLLKAIRELDIRVLFIGQGPEQERVREFSRAHNISTTFLPRIPNDELPRYYNAAKLCVFASLHEGNPKALLEAMSCELPVIACDVIGVNNIITNKVNGLLCQPEDTVMRQNILTLLKNVTLRENLGQEARNFVIKHFSFHKTFSQEMDIYKTLSP